MMSGIKIANFAEIEKDTLNGCYDFTVDGKCSGCGGCCSNMLPMTDKEVKIIKGYIRRHNITLSNGIFAPLVNPSIDITCPFLDKSKSKDKCKIYEVRPAICRYFICSKPSSCWEHADMWKEDRKVRNVRSTFYG